MNPFTTPFTCKGCGCEGMRIDMFPGERCIECHAAAFEMPTAGELAGMFRGVAS